MEGHGDSPPIWPQPPISAARRRNSSPLLTPPLLIILFPIITLVLLFFAVPLFVSLSSQIFAQARVKKSWDTLNVLLVLFAVICGICARRNDVDEGNGATKSDSTADEVRERWFESRDRKIYDSPARTAVLGAGRLRRSSSSYPDLRQEYSSAIGDDRIRFFDDFELDKFRSPQFHPAQLRRWRNSTPESDIKVIPVDTFVLRSSTPPATPPPQSPAPPPRAQTPPPPPPPPPPTTFPKQSRIYRSVGAPPPPPPSPPPTVQKQSPIHQAAEAPPPAPPPPPPPPPPPICGHKRERRLGKLERTKSSATKELKMVLSSVQTVLYNQKRKKKRKNRTIYENADQSSPETPRNTAPPQPPPPPPLPSVFHNLFRKASKNKKIHSVPAPPPPPPKAVSSSTTLRPSKKKSQISSSPPPPPPPPERSGRRDIRSSGKPPLPAKTNRLGEGSNSYFNSGSQSPQIPIPLPPPFKMPELRFVTRGDFVKLQNNHSSRCNSPELEDIDVPSSEASDHPPLETVDEGTEVGNGGSSGPRIFCPSPDINIKADTFIARLRDGWKLEKIHSMREKQNVGPC